MSIIVLNWNGATWLPKCLASIREQTLAKNIETIFVDNASADNSVEIARELLKEFHAACLVINGQNLGFSGGNNIGAEYSTGQYLFFLNPDTWLEPDCIENLIEAVRLAGADAATPLVLNYHDDSYQDMGFFGFDIFGLPSPSKPQTTMREIFIAGGCSLLIDRALFFRIGGFDPEFFMYSEDADLSWRVWIAGGKIIGVPKARVHHRGASTTNPAGGEKPIEFRTTVEKRFLTNRNGLLMLLKNAQHLLLLFVPIQISFLTVESILITLLLRQTSYFRKAYLNALVDCWRLRHHVLRERRRVARFRKRGDFWMLRFLRLHPNRWFEIKRLFTFGLPKIDSRQH
ncbi:MAG: glycosyltransferase family 2 protein [Verrucomicrobiae bacterium]|nr:glycosyltransferase family 2 protein [Verrucomicrobiae bacterium]